MPQDLSWLSAVGSAAAALIVMYFFLQYIRERDKDVTILMNRVESLTKQHQEYLTEWKTEFLTEIKAAREQNQQIVTSLLSVNRETVQAVSLLGHKVGDMGKELERFRQILEDIEPEKRNG